MDRSAELYERSKKVTPGGVSSPVRAFKPNPLFISEGHGCRLKDADGIKYTFLPLIDLICGILAVVMMIIPTFANGDGYKKINNILGIIVVLFSIAIIVISILFMTQSWDFLGGTIRLSSYIQYGFWITLIGAIITLIGGIKPIAKNRMA